MKNILIVHQYFMKPDQAGSHRVYSHAVNLSKSGFNVTVITTDSYGNQSQLWEKENINERLSVFRLKNTGYFHGSNSTNNERFFSFLRFSFLAIFKIFPLKKDLIYATSTPLTVCIPALFFKFFFGKRYIFEIRDLWPDVPVKLGYLKNKFLILCAYFLEYLSYFFSSAIIVVSPGMKNEIIAKGFKNKKIFTVENGCDDFFDEVIDTDSGKILSSFGIDSSLSNKKILLYTGSITANYGIEYILELAKAMRNLTESIIFVVAGRGYLQDQMLTKAREFNILNKNFFFIGAIPKQRIPQLYSIATLSICVVRDRPEIQEYAVNNKFFDSIASGTPICTNFESYQTSIAVKNNFCVYIGDKGFTDASKTVLEYVNNEIWLKMASERAKKIATKKFNRAKQSQKIIEVIYGI